jgi:hypothetical protein
MLFTFVDLKGLCFYVNSGKLWEPPHPSSDKIPIILSLGRLRQEDYEFNLGNKIEY